jgi:hypothetical protein
LACIRFAVAEFTGAAREIIGLAAWKALHGKIAPLDLVFCNLALV